jgi:hypothetical protein
MIPVPTFFRSGAPFSRKSVRNGVLFATHGLEGRVRVFSELPLERRLPFHLSRAVLDQSTKDRISLQATRCDFIVGMKSSRSLARCP